MTWTLTRQKAAIFSVLCVVLAGNVLFAQGKGHGVEVRAVSASLPDTKPGNIVAASFLITNKTDREEEFSEALSLPANWQAVNPPTTFLTLVPQEQRVRIIAFLVPAGTAAATYDVTYSVRSQRDYGIQDTDTVQVAILPVSKNVLVVEEKPDAVIAGDEYRVTARLVNQGNSEAGVSLEATSTQGYPVKLEPAGVILPAGSSHLVVATVKTDERARKRLQDCLEIRAHVVGVGEPVDLVGVTACVAIIPKMTGQLDLYHRLPVRVELSAAGNTENTGLQVGFSGEGSLNEMGTSSLDFLFRGPDIQDVNPFGQRDEYRINYRGQDLGVRLGDQNYSLSRLTDYYRYGRGAGFQFGNETGIDAGAFFLKSRWASPGEEEVGTYIRNRFSEDLELKLNYLNKEQSLPLNTSDTLVSLEANVAPAKDMSLQLEYGTSHTNRAGKQNDSAYSAQIRGKQGGMYYSLEKIHAGPYYHGYYNDADYANGTLTFPISEHLNGRFSYQSYEENLDLVLSPGGAPQETYYQGGLYYLSAIGTSLSLDYGHFFREDRLVPATYHFKESSVRFGWGRTFRKSSIQAYFERGAHDDVLSGVSNDASRYSLYYYLRPSPRQYLTLFAQFGDERPGDTRLLGGDKSVGVYSQWTLRRNLVASLQYTTNGLDAYRTRTRRQLYFTTAYTQPNGRSWTLRVRHIDQSAGEKETAYLLSYVIPWDMPVAKSRRLGIVRGRVFDSQRPGNPGIPRVVVTAGDATAVTDEKGEFILASLPPGSHYISVDRRSIGLSRVPAAVLPIVAEVTGGETTGVQIPVVESARLEGRVAAFTYQPLESEANGDANEYFVAGSGKDRALVSAAGSTASDSELSEAGGIGNVLVELTDGTQVIRRVSDNKGGFSLQDLRPGNYTLKIAGGNLPALHYLEKSEIEMKLDPGDKKEVVVRVLPRLRPIKIISEGTIISQK